MRRLVAVAALCTLLGCSGRTDVTPLLYDACFEVSDCVVAATRCEELSLEFVGQEYRNAICTTECGVEGPLSPDCSRALIGRFGSCYPAAVAGGVDDTLVCFEPCDTDANCLLGFRCLGAGGLCGSGEPCPVGPLDAICVPGPG